MTAIAEQLQQKLPQMTARMKLEAAAIKNIQLNWGEDAFVSLVQSDAESLVALIGRDEVRRRAIEFMRQARAGMVQGPIANEKDDDTGQTKRDTQHGFARSSSDLLPGEGRGEIGALHEHAQTRQTHEGGGGHERFDTHSVDASPPSPVDSSGGQAAHDTQPAAAPAAVSPRHPEPRRGATAIAAMQRTIQEGWLIRYRVPNGSEAMQTPISNLAHVRRRIMRETGDHFHALVVIRALEMATARYAEANPMATPLDVLTPQEIAAIENTTAFEKVKLKAADWIRKYPELETADAE